MSLEPLSSKFQHTSVVDQKQDLDSLTKKHRLSRAFMTSILVNEEPGTIHFFANSAERKQSFMEKLFHLIELSKVLADPGANNDENRSLSEFNEVLLK